LGEFLEDSISTFLLQPKLAIFLMWMITSVATPQNWKKIKNKNKEAIPENFSGGKSFSILFVFERQYGRGITQVVHAASVFCIIMHQLKHRMARKFHLGGRGWST
jgi:hypothetical protein